jgi:glycosyltransferase involved in cell wall biosynthesis
MSICDAMSEEYKLRYKREFIPFHNPIEVNKWLPFTKKDWSVRNKFTILYAGRIGLGMKQSIKDIARVVTTLSLVYYDIIFEIQTRDISELKGLVKFSDNVRRVDPIAYEELPKKFSSVDLLLLPIDFDIDSINFLRFSFPTKITEYMISGTPILLYAPAETATTEYAIKDKWAFTVTERNDKLLYDAIERIYSDPDLRRDLGERARDIAVSREDADLVRDNFRKMLTFI